MYEALRYGERSTNQQALYYGSIKALLRLYYSIKALLRLVKGSLLRLYYGSIKAPLIIISSDFPPAPMLKAAYTISSRPHALVA